MNKSIIRASEYERELAAMNEQISIEKARVEEEARRYTELVNTNNSKLNTLQLNLEQAITERNQWIDNYKESENTLNNLKLDHEDERIEMVNKIKQCNDEIESLHKRCRELNDENDKQGQLLRAARQMDAKKSEAIERLSMSLKSYEGINQELLTNLKIKENSISTWKEYTKRLQDQLNNLHQGELQEHVIDFGDSMTRYS